MAKAKDKKGEVFLKVFPSVIKCFGLNPTQHVVMAEIHGLSNPDSRKAKNGWCYASKEHLAENCGVGRGTVFNTLNELERKGLLRRDRRGYLKPTRKWIEAIKAAQNGLGQGLCGSNSTESERSEKKDSSNIGRSRDRDSSNIGLKEFKNWTGRVQKLDSRSSKIGLPMRTKGELKREDKREDATDVATPLSSDTKKGKNQSIVSQNKEETVSSLIKLFSSLTGKKLSKEAMGQARGIVQNLLGRNYKQKDLESAIRWGVKERKMVDIKQLLNIVNWNLGNKRKEKADKKRDLRREMREVGPAAREALQEELDKLDV